MPNYRLQLLVFSLILCYNHNIVKKLTKNKNKDKNKNGSKYKRSALFYIGRAEK